MSRPLTARSVGKKIEVELERGGAGLLELDGEVEPALIADAVETRDHRDIERFGGAPHGLEVARNAMPVIGQFREIGRCLGMAPGASPR